MYVVSSTDGKYLGAEVPEGLKVGDTVSFGDFEFEITFLSSLESGHLAVGSPNYQIELED